MNKFGKLTFFAVLLATASACNQAPDGNQAAEGMNVQPASNEAQPANDVLQDGGEFAATPEPETNSDAPAQPARTMPSESLPEARIDGARRAPPKAPRPQPEPDPHAGHDMGNMANMSHD